MENKNKRKLIYNQVYKYKKQKPFKKTKLNKDGFWKIYFKHDGCSMLLFEKLDIVNAKVRVNALKNIYNNWKGQFIITR